MPPPAYNVVAALSWPVVCGALRQVANMADARLDGEPVAEVARDGLRLRRGLDDDEALLLCAFGHWRSR